MNELSKTLVFAAVGTVLTIGAVAIHFASQPRQLEQFALVGEQFYPEFVSANDARFLEIAAFDFEKRKLQSFRVEYKDEMWRIPSHFDYPAEAAERIGRTAASVMGIRREALAGRRVNEHERFGVIDPKSEDAEKVNRSESDSVGVRITLGGTDGDPLVDYIVGKVVEEDAGFDEAQLREIRGEEQRAPLHYVRRPDENETYVASISVDASTRFADWIEPDLLLLDASNLRELVINDYTYVTETERVEVIPGSGLFEQVERSQRVDGDAYKLTKDGDFGAWSMEGLDDLVEELQTTQISSLTRALDNIRILGVRPRFKLDGQSLLTPELSIEFPDSIRTQSQAQRAISQLVSDLGSKGFMLSNSEDGQSIILSSDQGELTAATNVGVVYHLYFGDTFVGSESEIELGISEEDSDESTVDDSEPEVDSNAEVGDEVEAGEEGAEEAEEEEGTKSRYLLVRVSFDPSYIGPEPQEPVMPTPPEAVDEDNTNSNVEQSNGEQLNDNGAANDQDASSGDQSNDPDMIPDDCGPFEYQDDGSAQDTNEQNDTSQDSGSQDSGSQDSGSQDSGAQDNNQDSNAQTGDTSDQSTGDQSSTGVQDNATDPMPGVGQEDTGDPQEPMIDPQVLYEQAMMQYQLATLQYQEDKAAYDQMLIDGQQEVDQLNARFAEWYYIISAESLETLRLSREDLVAPKEPEEGAIPDLNPQSLPGLQPGTAPRPPITGDDTTGDDTTGDDGDSTTNAGGDDTNSDQGSSNTSDGSGGDTGNSTGDDSGSAAGNSSDDSGTGSSDSGDQA